jgi:hypothetical protein
MLTQVGAGPNSLYRRHHLSETEQRRKDRISLSLLSHHFAAAEQGNNPTCLFPAVNLLYIFQFDANFTLVDLTFTLAQVRGYVCGWRVCVCAVSSQASLAL